MGFCLMKKPCYRHRVVAVLRSVVKVVRATSRRNTAYSCSLYLFAKNFVLFYACLDLKKYETGLHAFSTMDFDVIVSRWLSEYY